MVFDHMYNIYRKYLEQSSNRVDDKFVLVEHLSIPLHFQAFRGSSMYFFLDKQAWLLTVFNYNPQFLRPTCSLILTLMNAP
jgi:hypothetical protein